MAEKLTWWHWGGSGASTITGVEGALVGFHLETQFLGILPSRNIIQSTYKHSTQQLFFLLIICKVLGPVCWVRALLYSSATEKGTLYSRDV